MLARYDEDSHHWNYLKIKGPMFLIVDTFGTYRLVFLNHYSTDNHVILLKADCVRVEALKLENNEGFMLNYLIKDSIAGQSIFGIWSAEETLLEVEKEIQASFKKANDHKWSVNYFIIKDEWMFECIITNVELSKERQEPPRSLIIFVFAGL